MAEQAAGSPPPVLAIEVVSEAEQRVRDLVVGFEDGWRKTLAVAVDLGQALIDVKAERPHGAWLPWVESSFPGGERMAQRFMLLARKSDFVSDLPPGTGVTEALKLLAEAERRARGPRRVPGQVEGDDEEEGDPVPRYLIDVQTHEVVKAILDICFPDASTALDVTYGNGNFWGPEAPVALVAHDFEAGRAPDGVMDFRHLDYPDGHFDVVLFDPPHLSDAGSDSVMAERFRTASASDLTKAWLQGTTEAWRVAALGIVVKATDHVHGQRFVPMTDYIRDAMDYVAPYEVVHQVRTRPFVDPKWLKPQLSAINNGSTYLVWRKGDVRHIPR